MQQLSGLDYTIIAVYFLILIGLGFYLQKRASTSLEEYFLAGRSLPWWALGVSGMASFLDITGTMLIVSFLYMLGPRGLYIEFRGGAVLALIFMLLWTGKWHRRSGCMTNAEWMIYRFGEGAGGQFARVTYALARMLWTVGMLAYLVKGVGLFLSVFLPYPPSVCALIMITIATVYTMASGFYGVVFTDLFQSAIILIAVISISALAMMRVTDVESLEALAQSVTGGTGWTGTLPQWNTPMPPGYEQYSPLMMVIFFLLLKNIQSGLGDGGDPKYFGARNDRECGKLTFLWTWLMMFRWPMMMSFAVLGLFLVRDTFPDQIVLQQTAELIHQHLGAIEPAVWHDRLAEIIHDTGHQPSELITHLQAILGDNWRDKLLLVSPYGTIDPERILPAVILFDIPMGFRGIILVALIAASMSTFDSTVNATTALFTRDLYQRYVRPQAGTRHLILATYVFGVVLVACGFLLGVSTRSINDIWGWIIMGLLSGLGVPLVLRFYWWRFNGSGFATGMVVGVLGAVLQRIVFHDMLEWQQFALITTLSLAGCVGGTYLSPPTDRGILEHFYRTTRPFGLWGPIYAALSAEQFRAAKREHFFDIVSVPFVFGWQVTLFLLPMQLVIRAYSAFWPTLCVFLFCLGMMYVLWYRNLPPAPKPTEAGTS